MRKRHRALRRELAAFAPLNPRFDPRNVLSRSAQTLRGRLCSKVGVDLRTESMLQATFCLRAGANQRVAWFTTEPFAIQEILKPYDTQYTPDAAVRFWDGNWTLVETKYMERLEAPDVWMRLVRIRRQVAARGFELRMSTDRELFNEEENQRIRGIKGHLKCCAARRTDQLDAQLGSKSPVTVGEAEAVLGSRSAVYHLIAQRRLYVDFTQLITGSTLIYRDPKEIVNEIQLFSDW